MNAGISSFAFGWGVRLGHPPMDAQAVVEFARRNEVRVAQLGDNLPVHCLSAEKRAALKAAADTAGVRLELGARGLTERHLQTYVELCTELSASFLRFVVDDAGHEPNLGEITALLRNAIPALDAAGVALGIENHDRFRAADLRRLIDDVGSSRVGICLDTANSLGAGEGLEHVTEWLAPVTLNLHVKDVSIRRLRHLMGFHIAGCTLGEGQLPIRPLLDQMRARGYRGSVILEAWWPPGHDDAATVAGELASADAGIRTLKRWLQT